MRLAGQQGMPAGPPRHPRRGRCGQFGQPQGRSLVHLALGPVPIVPRGSCPLPAVRAFPCGPGAGPRPHPGFCPRRGEGRDQGNRRVGFPRSFRAGWAASGATWRPAPPSPRRFWGAVALQKLHHAPRTGELDQLRSHADIHNGVGSPSPPPRGLSPAPDKTRRPFRDERPGLGPGRRGKAPR